MFKQKTEKLGLAERVVFGNGNGVSLGVIPCFGANVNQLDLACNGSLLSVIEGVEGYEEMANDGAYKSSVLLPWPNRIKNGAYRFEGNDYQVAINEVNRNNALHGFIFNKPFSVAGTVLGDNFASIDLVYEYDGSEMGYPFRFKTQITYSLSNEEGFQARVQITNTDKGIIPIGFGWHPYIKMTSRVDNLLLQLPGCDIYDVDTQMIPTGPKSAYTKFGQPTLIGDTFFDSCFEFTNNEPISKAILTDPGIGISLEFWQERGKNGFDFLQIYTPPSRKIIALEPMTCGVDVLNNKNGLLLLQPDEMFRGSFGIRLQKT